MENQPKKRRSVLFPVILIVLVLAGGAYGYHIFDYRSKHEATDDAQIASNMAPVVSRISGYVEAVRVKDNQPVHKGDTLVILDHRDQQILVQQARAALETALSNVASSQAATAATSKNVNTYKAAITTANAQIEAARVNVWKTTEDLKRYANLIKDRSITQQQYEQALAAKETAEKQLQVLIEQKGQVIQQTGAAESQTVASSAQINVAKAMVKQREADVANALLNLSYTVIVAPEDGFVSKVPVQAGQFVQAGAQLFSLVRSNEKWVVANFKETQLSRMLEGQKAEIEIDAFPGRKFEAQITSFSPATGSSFSLLPPDNATGNFVKVVQRVPVRLDFVHPDQEIIARLRAGMNVHAEVSLQ